MKVLDLMTTKVASIRSDASLAEAARLMWDCDCGALPVVDDGGSVIGMVTDRDICMASWSKDRAPSALRIEDAMCRDVACAEADDSIAAIEGIMRSKQIRRVPVIDGERRLVGILSLADIVRRGSSGGAREEVELTPDQIALTLAQIVRAPTASTASAQGI
jgi:CBS-domain-containing membrane protein